MTTHCAPATSGGLHTSGGPATDCGKAISSRNSTTHGVFARDVVLPALGEDPEGYAYLQAEWTKQLVPRNLLEQHYVEKIAAASWRLRRLHRWQAQLFEDDSLTEDDRLDKLDKVLRHETALHRQIDTAVKLLAKDVPQLYTRRLRDQVLEDYHVTERECRDEPETDLTVSLETGNRLYQLRKATAQAANELSVTAVHAPAEDVPAADMPVDTGENCQNEPPAAVNAPVSSYSSLTSWPFPNRGGQALVPGGVLTPTPPLLGAGGSFPSGSGKKCQNEPSFPLPF